MKFADMAAMEPSGSKHAALLLHAMVPADQEWLLSQLSAEHQVCLRRLVAELVEMGVAKDHGATVGEFSVSGRAGRYHAEPRSVQSEPTVVSDNCWPDDVQFFLVLAPETVDRLADHWIAEPPALVAAALNVRDWPWRVRVMDRMPVLFRRKVEEHCAGVGLTRGSLLGPAVLKTTRFHLEQGLAQKQPHQHRRPHRATQTDAAKDILVNEEMNFTRTSGVSLNQPWLEHARNRVVLALQRIVRFSRSVR